MPQTILITGGTGKFGRKFVEHFLKKKWRVIFTTTSELRGKTLVKDLGSPDNLLSLVFDFTESEAIEKLLIKLKNKGYLVNHLVNNARSLDSLKTDSKGQASRTNLMSEYLLDVVVPYELSMSLFNTQSEELKTITNIGSQYGLVAANPYLYDDYPKQSPIQYGIAKAALIHLTKELAIRMASDKVRVNCIAYGGVDGRVNSEFKKRYSRLTPMGRMLNDEEIVGSLDFLVSEESLAITGHTLPVDGGWTLW